MMLLIDIGLTLLGGPAKSPATFLTELLGLPAGAKRDVADLVFCRHHKNAMQLIGDVSTLFHTELSSFQTKQICDYWAGQKLACRPLPGVEEFCSFILQSGYSYCIVSNLWKPFHEALSHYLPDFERNAKKMFLSYEMGFRKPSRDFYDIVFSEIGKKYEAVMIGDSLQNDIIPCLDEGVSAILVGSWRNQAEKDDSNHLSEKYGEGLFHTADNLSQCKQIIINHFSGAYNECSSVQNYSL